MALVVNKSIGTPAVRFTPDFYKRAYRELRDGVYRDVIEMIRRAETDSHVAGCLVGRKAGFQRNFAIMP
ncbi:hypothetical protein GWO43_15685, partial [candidate division KSB1 bacterium]|nr:hypothetical protein [candidate division KSB1 bacterium]NIR68522.1 hypothetical protein [candidate division KSB1 bacterium]NIS25398.1 hypothetical protein [candidate division KSB1 bacterium]NIT72284.1 hypothetical protein [candidate division KSB1 bacterium]NIU89378.1 hypothetical protein [candidate division KSB1 bacterium]